VCYNVSIITNIDDLEKRFGATFSALTSGSAVLSGLLLPFSTARATPGPQWRRSEWKVDELPDPSWQSTKFLTPQGKCSITSQNSFTGKTGSRGNG